MQDAAGNALDLRRDSQGNLQEIRTPHGHRIQFQYDDQSRIARAEDDQGHRVDYRYDGYGMLTDAIFSVGRARHYSYDGALMTMIADEKGTVLLRNSYQSEKLVRQDFGNGQIYSYDYARSANGAYAGSVNVMLPSGAQTQVSTESSVPNRMRTQAARN
jgi:YD repeat-containing protein